MPLTHAQKTGLEAAILAYLTAEGGRFARTVAAFQEEAHAPGGIGADTLEVSGAVLGKAWEIFTSNNAQSVGLEAAILEYLTVEGGRFARTVAAFKEEAQQPAGFIAGILEPIVGAYTALVARFHGAVLEKAWTYVHHRLVSDATQTAAFFDAIKSGDLAGVQLYVCVGVDVAVLRDEEEDVFPLFCAAFHNRLEIVHLFVKTGHDKDKAVNCGSTPLHIGAQEGNIEIVKFLVEQGADKDKACEDGDTALTAACGGGHAHIAKYLLEQGCDTDRATNDDWTALHYAALGGCLDVAQVLFRYGAKLDARNADGDTALIMACGSGHADFAEYLLDQGCDKDHANNDGWTALHCAARDGHVDVAQVLFRYGVKLDARDSFGETPADVANRYGHQAFADALRAEEIRRRDHGFKRDRSTIEGTEEHEAAKRPRVEEEAKQEEEVDESDDDDDDDEDEEA